MRTPFSFYLLIVAAALAASPAYAAGPAQLRVATNPQHGPYLTNGRGLALYAFSRDMVGTAGSPTVINCAGTCLQIWTPLFTDGTPLAGPKVHGSLVGITPLEDDSVVTYNGAPLYTYIVDNKRGETDGQGMASFNGVWQLMAPTGKPIAAR